MATVPEAHFVAWSCVVCRPRRPRPKQPKRQARKHGAGSPPLSGAWPCAAGSGMETGAPAMGMGARQQAQKYNRTSWPPGWPAGKQQESSLGKKACVTAPALMCTLSQNGYGARSSFRGVVVRFCRPRRPRPKQPKRQARTHGAGSPPLPGAWPCAAGSGMETGAPAIGDGSSAASPEV